MSPTSPPSYDGYDGKDVEVAKDAVGTTSSNSSAVRLGESKGGVIATGGNVEAYKPIEQYEGAHRYDPLYHWTEPEEKRLIRKVRIKHVNSYTSVVCEAVSANTQLTSSLHVARL